MKSIGSSGFWNYLHIIGKNDAKSDFCTPRLHKVCKNTEPEARARTDTRSQGTDTKARSQGTNTKARSQGTDTKARARTPKPGHGHQSLGTDR